MKKTNYIIIGVVAVIVVGLFVVGMNKKEGDAIKIGAVLPLTGNMAPYGVSIQQGINIALEEINASKGINGRKLEMIYEDSQGDPKTGVSAFNKLQMIDNVPLVFGSLTNVVLAVQPEADKNQVVLINSSAISPLINEKSEDFLFNLVMNSVTEVTAMAEKFYNQYPNEKIAVFHVNNPSTTYAMDMFVQTLTKLGNPNIIRESFEIETSDFRVHLDRIRKSGAKFGYVIAFTNKEFADIFRQTKELNIDIQWFTLSTFESKETVELAGAAADGVIYSYPKVVDENLHSNFQKKYSERFNSIPDILTVNSYDMALLIAEVMKRYGTSGPDIQKGLRSIDNYYGVFGKFRLSDSGKQYVIRDYIWKTIEDGIFKAVEF